MTARVATCSFAFSLLALPFVSSAQLYVGPGANELYLSPGSSLMYERMKITAPAGGLTLTNTEITENPQAIGSMSGPSSILRTYAFNPGVTLSGVVDVFYQDAELNGNNEAQLQLAYGSSGNWQTTNGSTVDMVNNIVSNTLSNVQVNNMTAVENGVPLSMLANGFAAERGSAGVITSWTVMDSRKYRRFEVERSGNGRDWTHVGGVNADLTSGPREYKLVDADAAFQLRYYRLAMEATDGLISYSRVVRLTADEQGSTQIASRVGGFMIRFDGWQPTRAQLINAQGQVVRSKKDCTVWEESGLVPGIYLIKATNGSKSSTHKIAIR